MLARAPALVIAALVLLAPPTARAYETLTERVEMSDGVGLTTVVYLPTTGQAPWPALLARTPYSMDSYGGGLILDGLLLATNLGFAVAIQDTRGTGQSEGEAQPFSTDRADGLETLLWTLIQPWCNGEVLQVGASAIGIPAYLMAPGADPGLTCQALAIATPDVYAHAAYQGGALRESDVVQWANWLGLPELVPQVLAHRDCDAFWDPVRVTGMGADVRVAALHVGGWYDLFVQGNLDGFSMYRQSADPFAADHQYLVLGPWYHHGLGETTVGDFVLPPSAKWDLVMNLMAWTTWCTKGTGIVLNWPRVRYWVFGAVGEEGAPGNAWRDADDWPPPAVPTPLYLAPGGRLEATAPVEPFVASVPFDPADPSPTRGGRNLAIDAGPRDQAPEVEARADALLFTTLPLTEPLEAVGRVTVRLRVATDGPDGDVAVRLTDVYPDGRSMLVADGIQRLSRREGCEHEVAVVPGEPVDVEVDLWSVAWIFNAGHRVRVVVTGSNYPRFERTPALMPAEGAPVPITLTLSSSPEAPAALVLPVPLPPVEPEPEPEALAEAIDAAEATPEPAPAEVVEVTEAVETTEGVETVEAGHAHADGTDADGAGLSEVIRPPDEAEVTPAADQVEVAPGADDDREAGGSGSGCALANRPAAAAGALPFLALLAVLVIRRRARR